MSGVFRSAPSLPQAPQAPALGTLSKAASAPVTPTVAARTDIGVIHTSQYGFGHRKKRRRLPSEAELKRVFMIALFADQEAKKRRRAA